ncbi:MAG: hypothetical protein A2W23_04560 [Planctomycetes bacterium RBG_16_43_13]|nr:MAG: hypothetical protein A2W23_04560 [Planctomycetes bacterium RBG_16_43_13]
MLNWFWQLRLWGKIALLVFLSLILGLLLYIVVMAVQYNRFNTTVDNFIPYNADVKFFVNDAESNWSNIQKTELYNVIRKAITEDKVIRKQISTYLSGNKLPTLEDIGDVRFRQRYSSFISEYWTLRLFGKSVGGGAVIGDSISDIKILVATKISFIDFLLKPFIGVFHNVVDLDIIDKGNIKYFRKTLSSTSNIYIAIEDNIAVISNDEQLLISSIDSSLVNIPKVSGTKADVPIRVGIDLSKDNAILDKFRDVFRVFPTNAVMHFIEPNDIKYIEIDANYLHSGLHTNVLLHFVENKISPFSQSLETTNHIAIEPQHYTFSEIFNVSNYTLWSKLKSYLLITSDNKIRNETERILSNTLKSLIDSGFESRLLPQLDNASCIAIDSEEFTFRSGDSKWTGQFPTIVFIAAVKGSGRVVNVLDDVAKSILSKNQRLGSISRMDYNGSDIHFFDRNFSSFEVANVVNPYYAEVNGYLVLTTSKSSMLKTVDMLSDVHMKRSDETSTHHIAKIDVNVGKVIKATEGPIHLIAEQTVNTPDNRRLKRTQIEKAESTYKKSPSGMNSEEFAKHIDQLVTVAMSKERMERELILKQDIRFLDYLDTVNIKIYMEGNVMHITADVRVLSK